LLSHFLRRAACAARGLPKGCRGAAIELFEAHGGSLRSEPPLRAAPLPSSSQSRAAMAPRAVLKVPMPDDENRNEADALRHYDGNGAVRL